MTRAAAPEYSVIVTCFNEERTAEEFLTRLAAALRGLGRPAEIVVVDDGSADATFPVLARLIREEPLISVALELYRNSGQAAAITAALQECRGKNIVLIDSDLQLDPEELPMLVEPFERGLDIVSGYRKNRRDHWTRIVYSKLANMIMRKASRTDFRDFGCTFKVIRADAIRALSFGPTHVFSIVQVCAQLRRWAEVPVTHHPRRVGKSGWTLRKLLRLNTDNLLNLSRRPFEYLGLLTAIGAFLLMVRILIAGWLPESLLPAVTNGLLLNAILFSLLFTTTVQVVLGEIAMRSFELARRQPAYIVRQRVTRTPDLES
jgi:glycosyltransferase involved in cell wall biosynthesis